MLVSGLAVPLVVLQTLLVPAGLAGWALWRLWDRVGTPRRGALAAMGLIAVHCLYKQVFALQDGPGFIAHGLAERSVWEAAIVALGASLWWRGHTPRAGMVLVLAALAHGLWYSVILHNPMWSHQAVGALPLANLIGAAYGVIFLALALGERMVGTVWPAAKRAGDRLRIVLIPLCAFALLRQCLRAPFPQASRSVRPKASAGP
jgi:hypothetical protein